MIGYYKIHKTSINSFIYIRFQKNVIFLEIPYIKIENKFLSLYLPPRRYFICKPTKYLIYDIPKCLDINRNKIKVFNNLVNYKYIILSEKRIDISDKINLLKKC